MDQSPDPLFFANATLDRSKCAAYEHVTYEHFESY